MRGFERHVAALVPLIWGIPLTLACGGSAGTDPPPPPPAPTRGAIRVVTIHGGTGSDGNGLLVTLDGNDTLAIPLGNQIVVDSLLPGPHTVRIDDIAGNCHLQGSPTRSVGVVAQRLR